VEGLVERGASSWYRRDAVFCLALAGVFAVLQIVVVLPGWAEGVLFPFGFLALGCGVIAASQFAVGSHAWRCKACGVGLHPDRYVEVSEAARPLVLDAVRAEDAQAIVDAVQSHPRDGATTWWRLWIEHCPNCGEVALVHLERNRALTDDGSPRVAMSGPGVVALLEIAEVDLPG
jgi:predicted RNA-binding Zn-ribbon protein involved in translation (DUF1610 family)